MRTSIFALVLAASLAGSQDQQNNQRNTQQPPPPRDTSAQQQAAPTGSLSGRVAAADTGRPVKRARVFVSAPELPGGRAAMTDESGIFQITELPAGRYSVNVSKTGFIALSYGQRRPLMAGTPLQLGDGQQLKGIDFRLPRGGAIAGKIVDEDGEPMIGAMVRVLRYQYMQGDRRLVPVGTAQTDDKGQYRVWGLMPGDYYVNAVGRIAINLPNPGRGGAGGGPFGGAGPFGGGGRGGAGGGGGGRGGQGGPGGGGPIADAIANALGANIAALFGGGDDEPVAYAPTYFPGVGSVNEATAVTIGVSQEALDVNFGLQLVRTAKIAGRVMTSDGAPAENGNVQLTPEGAAGGGGRGQIGMMYGSRIQNDGAFLLTNVPPGRYTLRARSGNRRDTPEFAQQPLAVAADLPDLILALAPGGAISGTITFEAAQSSVDPSQVRVSAPAVDPSAFAPNTGARVEKDGTFTLDGIPAGARFIRANGARGWTLKSVTINGHETIDTPIDVKGGQAITGVNLVFTDKQTQISGTVTNDAGQPVTDYTVLVFSTDESFWRAQSRYIMTARPDQNGKYQMRGLPGGDYYVAIVDPAVQGEWFEPTFLDQHRQGAVRLTLTDGDSKTQDLRVSQK